MIFCFALAIQSPDTKQENPMESHAPYSKYDT